MQRNNKLPHPRFRTCDKGPFTERFRRRIRVFIPTVKNTLRTPPLATLTPNHVLYNARLGIRRILGSNGFKVLYRALLWQFNSHAIFGGFLNHWYDSFLAVHCKVRPANDLHLPSRDLRKGDKSSHCCILAIPDGVCIKPHVV